MLRADRACGSGFRIGIGYRAVYRLHGAIHLDASGIWGLRTSMLEEGGCLFRRYGERSPLHSIVADWLRGAVDRDDTLHLLHGLDPWDDHSSLGFWSKHQDQDYLIPEFVLEPDRFTGTGSICLYMDK